MIEKKIAYVDFNGTERTETANFHMSKQEILDWETEAEGDLQGVLQKIIDAKNGKEMMKYFKMLIDSSYGVKSEDGRFFRKSPEILADFKASPMYESLYMELLSSDTAAADFVKGIMPKSMPKEAKPN